MVAPIMVIDLKGLAHTIEWAEKRYGIKVHRAEELHGSLAPGSKVFRLVKLTEEEGPCVFKCVVLWSDPKPYTGITCTFNWPGAPDPPESGEGYGLEPSEIPLWYPNFVFGKTKADGCWGTGYGPGAMHGPGEGGPHNSWVYHPTVPSDCYKKHGWLSGTVHRCLQPTYLLEEVEGPPPPVEIDFRADDTTLTAGECTMLRWDVEGALEVYLDGKGVVGHSNVVICPIETTTYTLRVVCSDGDTLRVVTITVYGEPPGPTPPGAASRIAAELRRLANELEALDALAEDLAERL